MKKFIFIVSVNLSVLIVHAQDTFSIVALDTITREVGSAGASCVDILGFGLPASFLADLIPNDGAINTQADYDTDNQTNARTRMLAGDTPQQIITWLTSNDVTNNPLSRQYGIVGFIGNNGSAAGYTGNNCMDYKNHVTGHIDEFYYSIQGNILLGQQILDSMESRFRNEPGDLTCRLMAALQGANVVGADTRCANNGTSSLFAFLKVSLPTDTYGSPSFEEAVITADGSNIEPIDSLQTLVDLSHSCEVNEVPSLENGIRDLYPNPTNEYVIVDPGLIEGHYSIINQNGQVIQEGKLESEKLIISSFNNGVYILKINNDHGTATYKLTLLK